MKKGVFGGAREEGKKFTRLPSEPHAYRLQSGAARRTQSRIGFARVMIGIHYLRFFTSFRAAVVGHRGTTATTTDQPVCSALPPPSNHHAYQPLSPSEAKAG